MSDCLSHGSFRNGKYCLRGLLRCRFDEWPDIQFGFFHSDDGGADRGSFGLLFVIFVTDVCNSGWRMGQIIV